MTRIDHVQLFWSWQQSGRDLFGFLSCPGFVLRICFLIFHVGFISCMQANIWKHMKSRTCNRRTIEWECMFRSCTSESSHWRKMEKAQEGAEGSKESGRGSWTVCNVSVCICATIVLLMLECREGASLLNKEPCKFQLSTCDHSFGQRERFSPYPYLISSHSYTFFLSPFATRL